MRWLGCTLLSVAPCLQPSHGAVCWGCAQSGRGAAPARCNASPAFALTCFHRPRPPLPCRSIGNFGSNNVGHFNVGSGNLGSRNTGDSNMGDMNAASACVGSYSSADGSFGYAASGSLVAPKAQA